MQPAAVRLYATDTELADWLVRTRGVAFREAHHVTGRIVAAAEAKGVPLDKLGLADMQAISPGITSDVFSVLSPHNSVKSRTSHGGTAPQNVRKMARAWIKRLEKAGGKV
jgi:argininosuccinate lyase